MATITTLAPQTIDVAIPADLAALRAELLAEIANVQPVAGEVTRAEFNALVARVAALEGGTVVDHPPPPPTGDHAFYQSLLEHPDFVDAISYRDQSIIDARTVNASNNPSGSNEGVVYDPAEDGAALIVSSSNQGIDTTNVV